MIVLSLVVSANALIRYRQSIYGITAGRNYGHMIDFPEDNTTSSFSTNKPNDIKQFSTSISHENYMLTMET